MGPGDRHATPGTAPGPAELRTLVDALAAAHEHDWLHRYIKPSNILYLDGRWTLTDWAIVRRPRGQTTEAGRTGLYIGTEGFAAPELSVTPHEGPPPPATSTASAESSPGPSPARFRRPICR